MLDQQFAGLYLRHDFSKDEIDEMNKRLARQTQALRHKEGEKKAITAQFSSEIESIDAELGSLADKLNSGFEHRQMKCVVNFDWDKGKKHAIHPETGEIVQTQDISDEERQGKLSVDDEAKQQKKKK